MATAIEISAAVEGIVDEAVVRKLIAHVGATPGPVYGKQGKSFLRQRIAGQSAGQLDGQLVGFHVGDAGLAVAEMLFDPLPALGGQIVRDKIQEKLDQFATGDHFGTSSK